MNRSYSKGEEQERIDESLNAAVASEVHQPSLAHPLYYRKQRVNNTFGSLVLSNTEYSQKEYVHVFYLVLTYLLSTFVLYIYIYTLCKYMQSTKHYLVLNKKEELLSKY